jgi:hypothetical protein
VEDGNLVGLAVSALLVAVCVAGFVATALLWRNRPRR